VARTAKCNTDVTDTECTLCQYETRFINNACLDCRREDFAFRCRPNEDPTTTTPADPNKPKEGNGTILSVLAMVIISFLV
jgi:hypothetical protein